MPGVTSSSRSTFLSSGKPSAYARTTSKLPIPPRTTAFTAPNHAAVIPDSNSPSSFDATTNIMLTALTRPRISFGVFSWTSVCRTTTLTMSEAPVTTSATSERRKERERPNTMVARPKMATHQNIVTPARRLSGRCATTSAIAAAPIAGALRRSPSPRGPTWCTSLA